MEVPLRQVSARFRNRVPSWATLLLLSPLVWMVAATARDPLDSIISGWLPMFVLSGRIFTEPFNPVHAGFSLDQPTIGKWLFWFCVLTCLSVPPVLVARWFTDRSGRVKNLLFALPVSAICVLLLTVLAGPTCMLIQYVSTMGFTPKRVLGLAHCGFSWWLVPWFLGWGVGRSSRWPRRRIAALLVTALSVPTYGLLSTLRWSVQHWSVVRSSLPEHAIFVLVLGSACTVGWSICLAVVLLREHEPINGLPRGGSS